MHFRFSTYDHREARAAGLAFTSAFRDRAERLADAGRTVEWTEITMDWFAHAAPNEGVVVDAHPAKRRQGSEHAFFHEALREIAAPALTRLRSSECMVDLAHHRFRSYDDYGCGIEYWRAAYADGERPEMLLALESEAGKNGSPKLNSHMILEDASKLVAVASRMKVVVFGTNSESERDGLLAVASMMQNADYTLTRDGQRPCWLWIDLPWAPWATQLGPSAWVGVAGSAPLHSVS